jgi:hypothetical protein
MSERSFHSRVVDDLRDVLPESWVRSSVTLPSRRECDIVVDVGGLDVGPRLGFAIELESHPAECIAGAGQASQYAGELGSGYAPIVAYPQARHDPALDTELRTLSRYVPVIEL